MDGIKLCCTCRYYFLNTSIGVYECPNGSTLCLSKKYKDWQPKEDKMEKRCGTCKFSSQNNSTGKTCHVLTQCYNGEFWKPWQPKDPPTPTQKYKVRDGGFTIADWIRAEKCNDDHFRDDLSLVCKSSVPHDGVGFGSLIVTPITTVPPHFHECSTMREKFIKFGFVDRVEEEKESRECGGCRFSRCNNGINIGCSEFAPAQYMKCGFGSGPDDGFMPIVEKES